MGNRVDIKPISQNEAWNGRRFPSPKYKKFKNDVQYLLPKIKLPQPPFEIYLKFGFSSKASDFDNCIKSTIDSLAAKYKFNDKLIRRGIIETDIVPKGKEYFEFEIRHLEL